MNPGTNLDTVDNTKMLVTYHPVTAFHNTWVVLLMQRNYIDFPFFLIFEIKSTHHVCISLYSYVVD